MFYKYTHEMSIKDAQQFAKLSRANLVNTLIDAYKRISTMNEASETPELTHFLQGLLQQIEEINQCKNKTDRFTIQLEKRLENLTEQPHYEEISMIYDQCVSAIEKEAREAKDRDRFATQNKISKIKNGAVYTASIPSIAAVAGAILMAFYPFGLIVLGAAAVALVLSEVIFWSQKYQEYQKLNYAVKNMALETDYAEGCAIPLSELPVDPKQANSPKSPTSAKNSAEAPPVLISEEADKLVYESIELGKELVSDVADAVYTTASDSLYSLWSSVRKSVLTSTPAPTPTNHLHSF